MTVLSLMWDEGLVAVKLNGVTLTLPTLPANPTTTALALPLTGPFQVGINVVEVVVYHGYAIVAFSCVDVLIRYVLVGCQFLILFF